MRSNKRWIAHQRLLNQHIHSRLFDKPEKVVSWMGAMQAQNYQASLWGVGLRAVESASASKSEIKQAIVTGKIIRTWPMRGTLHIVAAEDVRWMLRLLTPRIIKSSAGRYRQLGLDDAVFSKSRNAVEKALREHKWLTRAEMYKVLEHKGISTEGQRGYHILHNLGQKGVICFGPQQGKQQTFVLLDAWVPSGRGLEGDEALAELTRRYFRSHGPATDRDFAWWSGLTLTDARRGIDIVQSYLNKETIDDTIYWHVPGTTSGETQPPPVFLLPAFDEYLLGYTDRSAVLESAHAAKVYSRNGIFSPAVIIEGSVKGIWKRTLQKECGKVQVCLFGEVGEAHADAVQEAAQKYGAFIEKKIKVTLAESTSCI